MRSPRLGTLRFDSPIRFGSAGNYLAYAPQGFGTDDTPTHTWNEGFVARLSAQIPAPAEAAQLRVDVDPFIAPGRVPFQDLSVYINGLFLGFVRAERAERLTMPLPLAYVVPTDNMLTFVMPEAVRPREIGVGADARRLAFFFREIALLRAEGGDAAASEPSSRLAAWRAGASIRTRDER